MSRKGKKKLQSKTSLGGADAAQGVTKQGEVNNLRVAAALQLKQPDE